jgi:hypothetical protein
MRLHRLKTRRENSFYHGIHIPAPEVSLSAPSLQRDSIRLR